MTDTTLAARHRQVEAELADDQTRWIKGGWYNRLPALFISSEPAARIIAGLVAVLLLLGMVVVAWDAGVSFRVPEGVRPLWFRLLQLLLAVTVLIAAAVEASYLAYYAISRRVWRHLRGVSIVYGVASSIWVITWLLNRFVLDAFFFDWVVA